MGEYSSQMSVDTWVWKDRPSSNFVDTAQLRVSYGNAVALSYFARPFPLGATVLSAKLRFVSYAGGTGSGSRTLTLYRIKSRSVMSRATWNNLPSIVDDGDQVTVTKTGVLPANEVWEFDVTSHMQAVSDGAFWTGWRLGLSTTEDLRLYGADSSVESRRPMLVIEWSDAPDTPTQMAPAGGGIVDTPKPALRWDYTDVSGSVEMSALQVQIHSAEAGHSPTTGWSAPAWDSGITSATVPQLNLAATTYPGMTSMASTFWSVRVRDGANLWSDWSDPAEMIYKGRGTFTLLSPAPGGTYSSPSAMDDATPVISWAPLSGATQASFMVRIWYGTPDSLGQKDPLWDSGRIAGTDTSITVPAGELRWTDRKYTVKVYVWDTDDRVATPGRPAYYSETTVAWMDWNDPATTDWLAVEALDPWPFVEVTWARDPAPDGWVIERDSGKGWEVIARLDYADVVREDGTSAWTDRYAPPRTALTYKVRPVINGKPGLGSPSASVMSEPVGLWLVNDTDAVCLIGVDEGSWAMGENSAVHVPIAGDRTVQIVQGRRGYEGSISGLLMGGVLHMEEVTASEWRDSFLRIKRDGNAWLTASTISIPVLLADMVPAPMPDVEEQYNASASFWQSGRFDWKSL